MFDISNLRDPVLVGAVETECGSHTAIVAPDLKRKRLIVYNNVSSGCDWIDVIEVPLTNPAGARLLRTEPLEGPFTPEVAPGCHDMGMIQGKVNLAACASADATNVFNIGRNRFPGGSLEDPEFLYTIREPGVGDLTQGSGRWHSASFTWDGRVIILGWEPGGGAAHGAPKPVPSCPMGWCRPTPTSRPPMTRPPGPSAVSGSCRGHRPSRRTTPSITTTWFPSASAMCW